MRKTFLIALISVAVACVGCANQGGYYGGYAGQIIPNVVNSFMQQQQQQQQMENQKQMMLLQMQQQKQQQQYQPPYQQQQQFNQGQPPYQSPYGVPQPQQNCQKKLIGHWIDQYGKSHPRYEERCL